MRPFLEKPPKLSADHPERQKNRHLKCECRIDECGYKANVTALHLREKGAPICPVHKRPMEHEALPADPRQKQESKEDARPEPEGGEPAGIEHEPSEVPEYMRPVPGDAQ